MQADVAEELDVWHPIDYKVWQEIHYHIRNFLRFFKQVWHEDTVDQIKRNVLIEAQMDINMMMGGGENGVSLAVWVTHFCLQPGDLFKLRKEALKWQQQYTGLHPKQQDHVDQTTEARERRRALAGDMIHPMTRCWRSYDKVR